MLRNFFGTNRYLNGTEKDPNCTECRHCRPAQRVKQVVSTTIPGRGSPRPHVWARDDDAGAPPSLQAERSTPLYQAVTGSGLPRTLRAGSQ